MSSERDIVERLRLASPYSQDGTTNSNNHLLSDAAATIETLRAEVNAWRAWRKLVLRYTAPQVPDPREKVTALKAAIAATDAAGALGRNTP